MNFGQLECSVCHDMFEVTAPYVSFPWVCEPCTDKEPAKDPDTECACDCKDEANQLIADLTQQLADAREKIARLDVTIAQLDADGFLMKRRNEALLKDLAEAAKIVEDSAGVIADLNARLEIEKVLARMLEVLGSETLRDALAREGLSISWMALNSLVPGLIKVSRRDC